MKRNPLGILGKGNPTCVGLAAICMTSLMAAQEVPKLSLKVKETIHVPAGLVRSIAVIGSPQCDGKGNIYYRVAMPAPASPMSGPIVRISSDGRHIVTIGLESVPDSGGNTSVEAWTVGLRAEVHLLAHKGNELYLIHFDDEGKFESLTEVDAHFLISQVAVFPSGELLTSGQKLSEQSEGSAGEPFTAIFDRNGKFIKTLTLDGDVKPLKDARGGDVNPAVSLGDAFPADDGNIYLMRFAQKPSIFVISAAGEVVRKLTLVPPSEGLHGYHFAVAAEKIVMEFFKPNNDERNSGTYLYSVYDAESGERQLDYETTPETNGIFTCYTPNQFTLLEVQDDGLHIVHAIPR